jgi:hypothetical protein
MDKDSKDKHKLVLMGEQLGCPPFYLPIGVVAIFSHGCSTTRATSHTRPRARDHYSSSTLIGGKGGAGPSLLLRTTLEGPTDYANARQT